MIWSPPQTAPVAKRGFCISVLSRQFYSTLSQVYYYHYKCVIPGMLHMGTPRGGTP